MIENIFQSPEQPEVELVIAQFERVAGREVAAAVSAEPIDVRIERRIIKHGSEIRTRGKQVKCHPRPLKAMCRDQRELMVRHSERACNAAARDLRHALVAVGECV